jgi:hypothetical protein
MFQILNNNKKKVTIGISSIFPQFQNFFQKNKLENPSSV